MAGRPQTLEIEADKRINTPIDEDTKLKFKILCITKGKSMSDVIRDYVVNCVKRNAIN